MTQRPLSWAGIIRLGLVQTALGAIVVLTTSTINRIMVVELGLAAMVPGALVVMYHAFQTLRPRWGHGADQSRRRTPWIIGGMAVLALGGFGAAASVAWMETELGWGLLAATVSFVLIGLGLGASATNLLALLAVRVAPERKPAAASIVWIMMIAGLAVTGASAGQALSPYSPERLVLVSGIVSLVALALTVVAVWGMDTTDPEPRMIGPKPDFFAAIRDVWSDVPARNFAIFVFAAMVAYNTQDLILEPFAGHVFGMDPGQSTALAGVQHSGALLGMILVAVLGTAVGGPVLGSMRLWTIGGCIASGAALVALGLGGMNGPDWPLQANVFALGFANGCFAVAAIGSMMGLASNDARGGRSPQAGLRMGVFGAAQSLGFATGGFAGTAAVDALRLSTDRLEVAYGSVFIVEGFVFLLAALLAARAVGAVVAAPPPHAVPGE
ncbi:MAG: BCD family MFS transporter [Pseudomonadota bacterium]